MTKEENYNDDEFFEDDETLEEYIESIKRSKHLDEMDPKRVVVRGKIDTIIQILKNLSSETKSFQSQLTQQIQIGNFLLGIILGILIKYWIE